MFIRTHRPAAVEPELPPPDSLPPLEPTITRFDKYSLFETASMYYLIGSDRDEKQYKVLKLNRCVPKPERLADVLSEDKNIYTKPQLSDMLHMINEGNKNSGGLTRVGEIFGLVGFVKFLDCYYFTVITARKKVGCIAHNDIYAIKSTEVYALLPRERMDFSLTNVWNKMTRKINRVAVDNAEVKYLGLFQFIDLSKDFFFSYTYDLTHSLQHNYTSGNNKVFPQPPCQEMFEWGYHQSAEMRAVLGDAAAGYWVLPIIHGSFQQRRFDLLGQSADLVLIARRSRHYAGTRYLKRGISVHGRVANDCEMEQILQVNRGLKSTFASHVQMRGSIPTYWYQETSVTMPKPPILVNRIDPNYKATQDHFGNLMMRYGAPIVALDLVKQSEKRKRESIIGKEFRDAVEVINSTISDEKKIRYIALDFSRMSRAAKLDSKREKLAQSSRTGAEWSNFEQSLGNQIKVKDNAANANNNSSSGGGANSRIAIDSKAITPARGIPASNSSGRLSSGTYIERGSGDTNNVTSTPPPQGTSTSTSAAANNNSSTPTDTNAPPAPGSKLDVLNQLKKISQWTVHETSFFCSTTKSLDNLTNVIDGKRLKRARKDKCLLQNGALRTNCIDCLDRTNVAQFAAGASFLSIAMVSLGLLPSINDEVPSGLLLGLMDLYSELGDRIALQYGGSEAHKKVAAGDSKGTEGSKAPSKQAELLTSIKRYYSNAFTDRLKQDAMNLFLGYFIPRDVETPLWELENDYALHNMLLAPPETLSNIILYNIDSYIRYYSGQTLRLGIDVTSSMLENVLRPSARPEDLLRFFQFNLDSDFDPSSAPVSSALESAIEKQLKEKMDDFVNVTRGYLIRYRKQGSKSEGSFHEAKYLLEDESALVSGEEKKALQRHEKTKLRLQAKKKLLASAYHLWWKHALAQYKAGHAKLRLQSTPMARAASYYKRVHGGATLCSFDDYFSEEYNYPYDASIMNLQSAEDDAVVADLRAMSVSAPSDRAPSMAMLDRPVSMRFRRALETPDMIDNPAKALEPTLEDDDEAFSISKFVFNIGAKASKALKGGISRQKDGQPVTNQGTSFQNPILTPINRSRMRAAQSVARNTQPWDIRDQTCQDFANKDWGMAGEIGSTVVGLCLTSAAGQTQRMYAEYEKHSKTPEVFIKTSDAGRKADFEYLIKEHSLSCDNVKGMESLSTESLVSGIVKSGVFDGLARETSAVDAYFNVFGCMVFTEPDIYNQFLDVNDVRETNTVVSPIAHDLSAKREFQKQFSIQAELYGLPESGNNDDAADGVPASAGRILSRDGRDSDGSIDLQTEETSKKAAPGNSKPVTIEPFKRRFREAIETDAINELTRETLSSASLAVGTGEYISAMNSFLSTPAFVSSTNFDASLKAYPETTNLDIPEKAKETLNRVAQYRGLSPGLEDEAFKIAAHIVFMHSLYSRAINLPRLSNRMSSFTAYGDFALYLSQFSTDVVMTEWDTLKYLVSVEDKSSKKHQGVDELKEIYADIYKRYQDNRSSISSSQRVSILGQVKDLLEQKHKLQEIAGRQIEDADTDSEAGSSSPDGSVVGDSDDEIEDVKDTSKAITTTTRKSVSRDPVPDWFVSPDNTDEDCNQEFHKIMPGIFQKNDNEFFIGNAAAVTSYFTFNRKLEASEK